MTLPSILSFNLWVYKKNPGFSLSLSFFFFRAALKAYGDSQARGQIGAAAEAKATRDPSLCLRPTPQPQLTVTPDP